MNHKNKYSKNYIMVLLTTIFIFYACNSDTIDWEDADQYYGEYKTVEGRIVLTHNSGKACFLNFHPNYKKYFTAVIFSNRFNEFPKKPEDYYRYKFVQVSGLIKEYKGKPEIILESKKQIKIIN